MPDGLRGPLARRSSGEAGWPSTSVDVEGFERLALPTLEVDDDDDDNAIVTDEIGCTWAQVGRGE